MYLLLNNKWNYCNADLHSYIPEVDRHNTDSQ